MRALIKILSFILLLTANLEAQEFIATKARLSKEAIGKTTSASSDHAILMLDEQSNKFSFTIRLFPILGTPGQSDSIVSLNQKITMSYRADFPIDDLDFFDAGNSGKQYAMDGELKINNVTKPVKVHFYLEEGTPLDADARDIHSYPVRISFALEINPAEYGLDLETANFTEKISVMVENGIINRSSSEFEQ